MADSKIRIVIEAEDRNAKRTIQGVGDALTNMGSRAGGISGSLSRVFEFAGGQLVADGIRNIASSLVDLGGQALDSYASFERLQMSLQTFSARELINAGVTNNMQDALAMSTERAKELQGWIEKLAVESPFNSADIANAFRLAQAYGFTSDQAMRLTQATVDFAAGAGISGAMMDRISLALGQIQARGKVSAQELNQLSEAGINARQILADAFGVSTASITGMIEKGLVPANLAIEAITQSLETDFGGAAQRQANTFSGLISSLEDLKSIGLREFFTGTFQAIQPLLIDFVSTVTDPTIKSEIRAWGDAFGQNVAAGVRQVSTAVAAFRSGGLTGLAQALQIPQPIISALSFAAQNINILKGALLGLSGVLAAGAVVAGLTAVGAALAALVSPIGLITLGAMALGAAWQTNFGGIRDITADVAESIGGVVSAIQTFLASADVSAATTALTESFAGVKDALSELFAGDIGITEFTSKIFDAVSGIPGMVRDVFAGADFSAMRAEIVTALGLDNVSFDLGALQTNISSAISSIDWSTLPTAFEALKSTVIDTLSNTDWSTVSTAFESLKSSVSSSLTGLDWSTASNTFESLRTGVLGALSGIDWAGLFTEFDTLKNSVSSAIGSIDWSGIGQEFSGLITVVSTGISSIDWSATSNAFDSLKTTVSGAITGINWSELLPNLATSANTLRDNLIQSLADQISNIDWSQISLNIAGFINRVASSISEIDWSQAVISVSGFIGSITSKINSIDWSRINVADLGAALGAAIATGVAPAATAAIAGIAWVMDSENFGNLLSSVKGAIAEIDWGPIGEAFGNLATAVVNSITNIDWSPIGGAFASLGSAVVDAVTNLDWSGVTAPFASLGTKIQDAVNAAISSVTFGFFGNSAAAPAANATGTSSFKGGLTWVDEKGAELFRFPDGSWAMGSNKGAHLVNLPAGTQIYPHEDAQKMMGAAGLTAVGQNATGTTRAPSVWPGGGSSFGDLSQAQALGARFGNTAGSAIKSAMKKATDELKAALSSVPGLFNTSQVTQQQMDLAKLGVPQNFADDWIRHLTDEVVNGVNWSDADIQDAAVRAGIDPTLPAKAILELVKQKWNDSSFFAGGKNTDLINQDAVRAAMQQQADAKSGRQALYALFGITPEQAQGQAVALGGMINTGVAQGMAGTGGQSVGAQFVNNLATGITPETMAPVATQITSGIVSNMTTGGDKEQQEAGSSIGTQIANAVVAQLTNSDALTGAGQAILQKIVDSWATIGNIDIGSKIAAAMTFNLGTADAIQVLQDVGKKIFKLVYQGYDAAAAGADYVAPVASAVNGAQAQAGSGGNAGGTTTTTTTAPPPAPPATAQASGARSYVPALAAEGGVTINNTFMVASQLDVVDVARQVAYQVAAEIQRRGRR